MNRFGIVLLLNFLALTVWADGSRYASKSVLSEGRWVKVSVDKTGIYKLTYAELRKMGFSNPDKVSVHGYGGWIMDEDFGGLSNGHMERNIPLALLKAMRINLFMRIIHIPIWVIIL